MLQQGVQKKCCGFTHGRTFKIPVYQSAWNGDFSELVTGTTAESPSVLAQPWGIKQGRRFFDGGSTEWAQSILQLVQQGQIGPTTVEKVELQVR